MKKRTVLFLGGLMLVATIGMAQDTLREMVARSLPALVEAYKQLHSKPELSGHEELTAAFVGRRLQELGYSVTTHVGKFKGRPWNGYGVVAMMKNGDGPVIMIRADLDALPIEEKTGLPYARTVRAVNQAGATVGVMHACGHDIHVTCLLGTAEMLAALRNKWKGTVLLIGQPAEEGGPGGSGAEAMLNDSLYGRWPRPDCILGLHQMPLMKAGQVSVMPGYINAIGSGGEIIIHGVAAHPARPQEGKDPIILAAHMILAFQTELMREVDPLKPATLTVGAIHGGVAENAIPDEVRLKLSFRALDPDVFLGMQASVTRIARATALAAGIPENKMPEIHLQGVYPANYNNPYLSGKIKSTFIRVFGAENVVSMEPLLTGEDFSFYGMNRQIPSVYFLIGSTSESRWQMAKRKELALPANHSPLLAPAPEESIRTGVIAMTSVALELLGN